MENEGGKIRDLDMQRIKVDTDTDATTQIIIYYSHCSLITHNLRAKVSPQIPVPLYLHKSRGKSDIILVERVYVPFLAPWKKNRTINTCNPAIETIINPSITLKFQIRRSVLRTVLKLRFSRVRKYFWLREMVESWAESLKIDSSIAVACSGLAPWREGSSARCSFSSCGWELG
jgi:hypothetical protein